MAEPFEITTDLISFYSEYSVVMMRYSFLIYKYIYLQMLTAHNGQLAPFVCVMSYVFKFSIAYIHVYNDEKSPAPSSADHGIRRSAHGQRRRTRGLCGRRLGPIDVRTASRTQGRPEIRSQLSFLDLVTFTTRSLS